VQREAAGLQFANDKLKTNAVDLVRSVRNSISIDWNCKESVKAGLRFNVRHLPVIDDCLPNLEERAVNLFLDQVEVFAGAGAEILAELKSCSDAGVGAAGKAGPCGSPRPSKVEEEVGWK